MQADKRQRRGEELARGSTAGMQKLGGLAGLFPFLPVERGRMKEREPGKLILNHMGVKTDRKSFPSRGEQPTGL